MGVDSDMQPVVRMLPEALQPKPGHTGRSATDSQGREDDGVGAATRVPALADSHDGTGAHCLAKIILGEAVSVELEGGGDAAVITHGPADGCDWSHADTVRLRQHARGTRAVAAHNLPANPRMKEKWALIHSASGMQHPSRAS